MKFSTDVQTAFIDKLAKIEFTKDCGGDKLRGLTPNGIKIEFSLSTELANNHHDIDNMPVQIVARVFIGGKHATSWGATDNADNAKLVRFFQEKRAKAQRLEYELDKLAEKQAKSEFEAL